MELLDIILYEGESTSVEFKAVAYKPANNPEFIKDVMAMANALLDGDRYLIVGVKHYVDNTRDIIGLEPQDQLDDAGYHRAILDNIEPEIGFEYSYIQVEGKTVGVFRIYGTDNPPYMMRKDSAGLKIGHSVIRKGTSTFNVRRADIDRMFNRRLAADPFADKIDVELLLDDQLVDFVGAGSDKALPSEVARQKITRIIAQKQEQARQAALREQQNVDVIHPLLGSLNALKKIGPSLNLAGLTLGPLQRNSRYEDRTVEELEKNLQNVDQTYAEDDLYDLFEVQAHKVNFLITNNGDQYVEDCSIQVTVKDESGIAVAEQVYSKPTGPPYVPMLLPTNYPDVQHQGGEYSIRDKIRNLKHRVVNHAFSTPVRLFIPQQASGQQLHFHLVLTAKNLKKPVRKEVVLSVR